MKRNSQDIQRWAKQNPTLALFYGMGGFFILVLIVVIGILVARGSGPSKKDLTSIEQEPNAAKRVRRLVDIEAPSAKRKPSSGYREAMARAHEALMRTEALPEDIVALARAAAEAGDVENEDFAWWVAVDTRLRRGVWPKYPEAPPKDARVGTMLREALRNSRVEPELPKDPTLRDAWLKFVVEDQKNVPNQLLGELYKEKDTQENRLLLYQQLVQLAPAGDWLAQRVYDSLGLLPEPIYVSEQEAVRGPAVARGPENTLRFVGVLEGERCAIAAEAKRLPPLWVRTCKGLQPRRMAKGELFLIGVDARYDFEAPMHWLPVLVDDSGGMALADDLRSKVDDRVLASFIVSAPRYVLEGKAAKSFEPTLALVSASLAQGGQVPSFRTSLQGKPAAQLLTFSSSAKAKWAPAKACGKIDKDRCDPLRGADKCDVSPAVCVELPGGALVRWAKAQVIHPEPCLHEYGEKSDCKFSATTAVFVDAKSAGAADFKLGPTVTVHVKQPDTIGSSD